MQDTFDSPLTGTNRPGTGVAKRVYAHNGIAPVSRFRAASTAQNTNIPIQPQPPLRLTRTCTLEFMQERVLCTIETIALV